MGAARSQLTHLHEGILLLGFVERKAHLGEELLEFFLPLRQPSSKLTGNVVAVVHALVQAPVPQQHEPELPIMFNVSVHFISFPLAVNARCQFEN